MKRWSRVTLLAAAVLSVVIVVKLAPVHAGEDGAPPIFGVTISDGYLSWELVGVSHEQGLDELRGILGNATAMQAYRKATLPFPDGTILAKLAWKYVPSAKFPGAFVPGSATTVQIMVKDSKSMLPPAAGIWPFHRRKASGRGPAHDLPSMSPGQREEPRPGVHVVCALSV